MYFNAASREQLGAALRDEQTLASMQNLTLALFESGQVDEADRWMREQAIVDPERLTRAMVPGLVSPS